MKKTIYLMVVLCLSLFRLDARSSEVLVEVPTPIGELFLYRPSSEEMQKMSPVAKKIFVEAFSTTYREYHLKSGSSDSIEKWLRLRGEVTLEGWLSAVFDDEYQEYLAGTKEFIFFSNAHGDLVGWLSYSPMSAQGELYLSQCSLEAGSRNKKVATSAFAQVLQKDYAKVIFPGAKVLKVITRKINAITKHLFTRAGFIMDETIDPAIYGESYDDRYVGYRLILEP